MRPFAFQAAPDAAGAVALGAARGAQYLAGGTTQLDLMKLDVLAPATLVDISALAGDHAAITTGPRGLRLGALATMADAAAHPAVRADYPLIADALRQSASTALRNMATLGGNVLQRTRCPYFRDVSWRACNKRDPGSGCAALGGVNRREAVLGVSDACIATYAGDFAQALVALDAQVVTLGPRGPRRLPFEGLHRLPGATPHIETNLAPGELIVAFEIPAGPWTRRSLYYKARDRASYDFALASAAVALDLDGEVVRQARIALGGVATRPWRSRGAEDALRGRPLTDAAAVAAGYAAFAGAVPRRQNAFKTRLGPRVVTQALLQARNMRV
jgi:xanthine dehydrogenase YagS FAD-binding subunit